MGVGDSVEAIKIDKEPYRTVQYEKIDSTLINDNELVNKRNSDYNTIYKTLYFQSQNSRPEILTRNLLTKQCILLQGYLINIRKW